MSSTPPTIPLRAVFPLARKGRASRTAGGPEAGLGRARGPSDPVTRSNLVKEGPMSADTNRHTAAKEL
eukprot:6184005-Pleurochrysis_carterae.AAC.3